VKENEEEKKEIKEENEMKWHTASYTDCDIELGSLKVKGSAPTI